MFGNWLARRVWRLKGLASMQSPNATVMQPGDWVMHVLLRQIDRFRRLFDVAWPALEAQLKRTLQQGMTSCKWTRWENWSTTSDDVLSLQVSMLSSSSCSSLLYPLRRGKLWNCWEPCSSQVAPGASQIMR